MINVNHGNVSVEGSKVELMAELTCLIKVLREDDSFSKDDIDEVVKTAEMSSDELARESLIKLLRLLDAE